MDDTSRCSLPSISNLLGLADGGSPTSETSPASQQGELFLSLGLGPLFFFSVLVTQWLML